MATDETNDEDQSATEEEGQEPDAESTDETQEPDEQADADAEDTKDDESKDDEEEESTLSPEDALKALSKVRKESAKYRTQLKELRDKMADAKTPDEVTALAAEIEQKAKAEARELLVENVALKHGLPAELAERLSGETREELDADAKKLAKFATRQTSVDDLSGGLDPSGDDSEFDPREVAKNMRRTRLWR